MNSRAEQLVRAIAGALYRKLRAQPLPERKRQLRLKLTPETAPLLFEGVPAECRQAWQGVEHLAQSGLVTIHYDPRSRADEEGLYRRPVIEVLPDAFEGLAELAGVSLRPPFERQVADALRREPRVAAGAAGAIATMRLSSFEGFEAADLARRFGELATLALTEPRLFIREASARVFNGLSKLLDDREELVAALTGEPCPWMEAPVPLMIALPEETVVSARQLEAIVFVENLTTFERLRIARAHFPATCFIYSAGWRACASRGITARGRTVYADREFLPHERAAFESALSGQPRPGGRSTPGLYFFGDLDFAGMGILAGLRATYGQLTAWQPGYAALLSDLDRGKAHSPEIADKGGQQDPASTGCAYADAVLLPALRRTGLAVDQEAWSPEGRILALIV